MSAVTIKAKASELKSTHFLKLMLDLRVFYLKEAGDVPMSIEVDFDALADMLCFNDRYRLNPFEVTLNQLPENAELLTKLGFSVVLTNAEFRMSYFDDGTNKPIIEDNSYFGESK